MQKLSATFKALYELFRVLAAIFLWVSLGAAVSVEYTTFFDPMLPMWLLILSIAHFLISTLFYHKYKRELFHENHIIDLPSIMKGRDRHLRK